MGSQSGMTEQLNWTEKESNLQVYSLPSSMGHQHTHLLSYNKLVWTVKGRERQELNLTVLRRLKKTSIGGWRRQWHPLQCSCLEYPLPEEPGRLQSMGSPRVRHDWAASLSLFTFVHWRRKWQPTPVFSPGESQGLGSPVGCRLWGRTESDTTEAT